MQNITIHSQNANKTNLVRNYEYSLTEKKETTSVTLNIKAAIFMAFRRYTKAYSSTKYSTKTPNHITRLKLYIHMTNPKDFKLRPIVAGSSCESHKLSNYLE